VASLATHAFALMASGHFERDDDAACGQSPLATGHSTLQFATAKASSPAAHCPLCHWQRAVGGASVAPMTSAVAALHALDLLIVPPTVAGRSTAVDERSSRAPPA
jgi:hypothetical protein